jgi:protein TonB
MSAMLQPREPLERPPSLQPDLTRPGAHLAPPTPDAPASRRLWWLFPLGALLLAGLGHLVWKSLSHDSTGPKRQTVKIAVMPDTPPPPPPPPKEEKRPEPDKLENKPQPQEQPKPVEAPPEPQQLKMEGAAGDGPSAFTAGSVSNDYKGGEIGNGAGTGSKPVDRMAFALFTSQLQKHIQASLSRQKDIKGADYRVQVLVQLDPAGVFQKVELQGSTGDAVLDDALRQALKQLPPIGSVPPNLPQPLRLRITNRLSG